MTLSFFFFFFFFACISVLASAGEESSMETFSRAEMAEIAGYGEDKVSTVLISGSVFYHPDKRLPPLPLPGISVAVSCYFNGKKMRSNGARGITNEFGDFTIDLPSHLHSIPALEKSCFVKLPRQSLPASSSNLLRLSSNMNGIRVYDTGVIMVSKKSTRAV